MAMPIPALQAQVKAAVASAKAATSMDPIKLIASDGSEIIIDRRAALVSGTIKSMLAGPGARNQPSRPPRHGPCDPGHFLLRRPLSFPPAALSAPSLMLDLSFSRAFAVIPGSFQESQQGEIKFPEINAKVLEKTVQYFYYKLKHTNYQGNLPDFKIEPEFALELLMAANFLDC